MTEQPRRKRPLAAAQQHAPWLPVPYELAHVSSLQALERGEASPEQQRRALDWIIRLASGTYDFPYRPGGSDGERDTNLALGRMFVGQQIVKMLRLNLAKLRREPNADAPEER